MEVIIHLLGSKEGQEELGKCVATVYAQLHRLTRAHSPLSCAMDK